MMILTDKEAESLAADVSCSVFDMRDIEAAILAKLASAELPEPTYWIWRTDSDFHFWEECASKKWFDAHSGEKQITYTADQLAAAVLAARNAALEEAKQLFPQPYQEYFGRESQDAIESLKEPT